MEINLFGQRIQSSARFYRIAFVSISYILKLAPKLFLPYYSGSRFALVFRFSS